MEIVFNDGDTERDALNGAGLCGFWVDIWRRGADGELFETAVEFRNVDYDESGWLCLYGWLIETSGEGRDFWVEARRDIQVVIGLNEIVKLEVL